MGRRRIESIKAHPDAELICISDNDEKSTESLAKEVECIFFHRFRNAISHDEVDCVVICTPNRFHAPISTMAMRHGKHVFCEKPLARNPKEALMMVQTTLKNNVFLKTGSNLRYFPSVQRARALVDNNDIGKVLFLRGWIGNSGGHLINTWYFDHEMAGGGTFLDNGSHLLDLTRWFLGEIETCTGYVTSAYWPSNPLEDNGFGLFRTLDGKLGFVQSSWTEWADYMYMEIYGTEGYIRIDNRDQSCKIILGNRHCARHTFDYSLQPHQSYKLELHEFIKAIEEKKQPLPSGYDGLRAVQMAHGIYESSKTGRRVKIYGETEEKLSRMINV